MHTARVLRIICTRSCLVAMAMSVGTSGIGCSTKPGSLPMAVATTSGGAVSHTTLGNSCCHA